MDLIDRMKDIAARIPKQMEYTQTEEATKNAFIMPFISGLGYDVFNPLEVIPEFTSDHGTKKGEKVDYAIKKDDKIIILVECKWSGADLGKVHASQLYRYFSVTSARFAILTNGIEYQFYSDIDEPNKMDSKPFFVFNMLHFEDHQINELKKFMKSAFSLEDILTTASTLKYAGAIKKILDEELKAPSEEFVRFFASQVYEGRLTQQVVEQFTKIVKEARTQFINERINERLKTALSADQSDSTAEDVTESEETDEDTSSRDGIETTQDELDGFNVVKAILREVVDVSRVTMRDTKSYCGILLDDNNRKPICRLRFNTSQKYLGLFSNKNEEKVEIDNVDGIFKHAERVKAVIGEYEGNGKPYTGEVSNGGETGNG
ncbi:type I restriction endonuclease [uncultured Gimesia sp.]|uniref:type I restriction endonuclease n=1 Tax=uncultured Gimesia sp. TaxID=1678688 RepID=UPI0030D9F338|tara:strand:+ start:414075 stop:415202 length:1128 start_codon:yes stop_codon:yes gene_type:complete